MNWTIVKRKKHNLDDEVFILNFEGKEPIKLEVAEMRHLIEDLDKQVNCFGR